MTPERWAEIERVFHEASALEAPARTAYLDEQCGDDRELRMQVEKYLALEQGGESLLDRPAFEHYEPPPEDPEGQLPPGTRLGVYRILDRIGAGGMGVVYRGEDSRLHRKVAIKVLQPALCSTPELRQRFERESRAIAALNHPNVCTLYDLGREGAMDYFVMELLDGETLAARLRAGIPTIQETLRIAVEVASGVAAAHGAGIIHRDLKPANVMLTSNGAKLLDFGISKTQRAAAAVDATTHTSLTGVAILGTSEYMSPEQAQGLKLDSRSDIFSFGALLYEMLTGRRAFRGETNVSTIAAILNREPEPLAETTPRELDRILQRCLRKDPARRFQTMGDLKVALEELKDESDSGRLAAPRVPVAGKRRWPLVAASVAMVALTVGGAWWRWGVRSAPTAGPRNLRQLTHDEGFTGAPSLSPDAKLVAYQTDRAGAGRFDIWVQQTTDGSAHPLTKGPGRHTQPVFSHDGSKVYFTSDGPPQGIHEMGAMGGEARLVVADGEWPAVSPDGNSIAYIGRRSPQIFVVPASGGEPRPIARDFIVTEGPVVWMPDSQQVVFVGKKAGPSPPAEYWVAPVSDGAPQLLSWGRWATENKFFGRASAWLTGDFVLSWLTRDGNSQVYRTHVGAASDGMPLGQPEPLTYGGSVNERPSVAAGKLAFQSGAPQSAIWSLPADTNQGRVTGAMKKLTTDKAAYCCVALTPDGKILAFVSDRIANENRVFLRDMVSGQERTVTRDQPDRGKIFVQIDASGTRVAYTTSGRTVEDPHIVSAQGGATRKVCDNCGFRTNSLSADGKQFLATQGGNPRSGITLVDVDSGKSTLVLKHLRDRVNRPRFSPDEKWMVFLVTRNATSLNATSVDVMLAPFRGATSVPEQDWITVTPAPANVSQAFWSPDGGLLYYILNASGSYYLMARRLDRNRHPAGAPFRVLEFPERLHPLLPFLDQMTAVPGRFVGSIHDFSYNVWIMDLPK